MKRKIWLLCMALCVILPLAGCRMEGMYAPPKRSKAHQAIQSAIDLAMTGLEYSAPRSGENLQSVQKADLDGDGTAEFLLFAKSGGEKPLQIKIFRKVEDGYLLQETISSYGASFDQVEYVDMDGRPGVELVVGTQLSDQVLRSVSVYTFADGAADQLMTSDYTKFLTCQMDANQSSELVVLRSGESEERNGVAVCFSWREGAMVRSTEVPMSRPVENMKRIMISKLADQRTAVYVASTVDEHSILTDVFAMIGEKFTNVSLSVVSGTSVQTLRNYFVYADDIDQDGVMELPELIAMDNTHSDTDETEIQYMIRWYAMLSSGKKVYKLCTFHNFAEEWYVQLDDDIADRIIVNHGENAYTFFVWDENYVTLEKMMSVYTFDGQDREAQAAIGDRFVLARDESVVYAAELGPYLRKAGVTREDLKNGFHLIRQAWKTGET